MDSPALMSFLGMLGEILAVGGTAAGIAYGLFVFLGKKWLENRFAERLEAYKHEQRKELEEIRFRINAQFNRLTKIHEREIVVLPKTWHELQTALTALRGFASPMRQYSDLDHMTEAQLEHFLASIDFADWEKDELRRSRKKLEYYQERIFIHELYETKLAFQRFHEYIQYNSIFLSKDIKDLFEKLDDKMWSAIIDKQVGHEGKDWKMQRTAWKTVSEDVKPLLEKIEGLVQKRLQLDQVL